MDHLLATHTARESAFIKLYKLSEYISFMWIIYYNIIDVSVGNISCCITKKRDWKLKFATHCYIVYLSQYSNMNRRTTIFDDYLELYTNHFMCISWSASLVSTYAGIFAVSVEELVYDYSVESGCTIQILRWGVTVYLERPEEQFTLSVPSQVYLPTIAIISWATPFVNLSDVVWK